MRLFPFIDWCLMLSCNPLPFVKTREGRAEQVVIALLSLLLLVNPFPHTQTIVELCFYAAFMGFLFFVYRSGVTFDNHALLTVLCLFGGWCFIISGFALDPFGSFKTLYFHFVKYLMLIAMLVSFFYSRQKFTLLAWVVVFSGSIFSLATIGYFYGILGYAFSVRLGGGKVDWPINPMGFVMLFSLALVFPLFLQSGQNYLKKTSLALSALLMVVAAILTQSRGTLIGLVLVLVISLCRYKKMLFVTLGCLTILLVSVFPSSGQRMLRGDKQRVALILYTIEVIKDYPVTGIGFSLDTFKDQKLIDPAKYADRIPPQYRNVVEFKWPHNIFLDVAVRTGLVGGLLFGVFLLSLLMQTLQLSCHPADRFVRDWGIALLAGVIMFLVKAAVEPVFMHFVEVVLYTLVSMVILLKRISKKLEGCLSAPML